MQSSGKIVQLGALGAGAADPLGDLGRVAVDVADGRVDLGQGYAHVGVLTGVTAEVSPPDADFARTAVTGRTPRPACGLPCARRAVRWPDRSIAGVSRCPRLVPAAPAPPASGSSAPPAARPTDHPDPNRNAYTVPEAPRSPACTPHFCVHWVAEGIDAPSLADGDGDGVPDYVERVQAVAEHVYSIENGKLGWREPRRDGRKGGGAAARPTSTWTRSAGRSSATRRPTAARRRRRTGCRATCTATSCSTTTTTRASSPARRPSTTSRSPSPTSTTTSSSSATTPTRTPGSPSRARSGWRTRSTTASTTTCATCGAGSSATTRR